MSLWEVMLCCGITAILVLGGVQLIDYECERKSREKRRRAALQRWFSQKMYNLETYGNLEGAKMYYPTFESEHPEYKSDYSRSRVWQDVSIGITPKQKYTPAQILIIKEDTNT